MSKLPLEGQKQWIGLLLAGLILRWSLLPFVMHVDAVLGGDILTINRGSVAAVHRVQKLSTYPPMAEYTIGLYQSISKIPVIDAKFGLSATATNVIFRVLFFSKLLYLLFDVAALLIWTCLFRDNLYSLRSVWGFWALNPLTLYNAYVHGQFDLIPVFFVVLSSYFASRNSSRWAAFWLGIAGCYKNFPLFFLLPLVIILAKSWRERLTLFLLGTVPYVSFMAPFLKQYHTSIGNYQNWYFKASYDLGLGAQVYLFFVFYAALLWYLHHRKAHTFEDFWRACFAILLVYYQFSYFDLHYWAWIVPFAAIYWVEYPQQARPFYLVIGLCLLVLMAPTPLGRFLAPISPRFFLRLPSLLEVLNPYLPMLFIVNVVRSLMAGTCFYLAWRLLRDMPAWHSEAPRATPEPVTVV